MVKCVCYIRLSIYWFYDHGVTIPNGSVTIRRTSLVSVGHPRSDLIVSLMLYTVCYAMAVTLVLYYRSLGTTPILLKMDSILGKLCMRVITYNVLDFSCIKTIK